MKTALVIPNIGFTRNQQAVLRSAEAFGVSEICVLGDMTIGSRISRGAHKHILINRFKSEDECLNYLIFKRYKIISVENDSKSKSLLNFKFPGKVAFVVGHERLGVPKSFLDNSIHLRIPQCGMMKCLNTSIATSIVLYERFKSALKI